MVHRLPSKQRVVENMIKRKYFSLGESTSRKLSPFLYFQNDKSITQKFIQQRDSPKWRVIRNDKDKNVPLGEEIIDVLYFENQAH